MKYSQNWNIDVVFPGIDSPELKTAFKKTENKNQALTAILASLKKNSSNEKIIEAADALQTAEAKLDTIAFYLTAWSSTNYAKAEAGPNFDLLSKILIKYGVQEEKWGKFLAALPEDRFNDFLSDKKAQPIAFILKETREQAGKLLDEKTENVIKELQVDGVHAWWAHYDTI